MDEFLQNLGWKKGGLLLIGVAVLGFLLLFLIVRSADVPESQNTVPENLADYVPTPTLAENADTDPEISRKPANQVVRWLRYESGTYTVFYPEDFLPEERDENGSNLTVFLPNYGDSDLSQRLEVLSSPQTEGVYDNAINELKSSGLAEDTAVIDESVAPRFKGLVGGYLRQTSVVYQKNNRIYEISLFYPSTQQDAELEKLFDTFTAGFRVK